MRPTSRMRRRRSRGANQLAVGGSRGRGDAFVHQGSPKIVGAAFQAGLPQREALLDPGRLDVGDVPIQDQAGNGMHFQHVASAGAGPDPGDAPVGEHGRLGMDEAEWHELGEAAAAPLQVAQQKQVASAVARGFQVAVHDGGAGGDSQGVSRGHHLDPLIGADPSRGDNLADPVVQDFCRGARQTADSGLFQRLQVVADAQAGLLGPVEDLFRGKGVKVDGGRCLLHRPAELDVVAPIHAGRQARLDADLRGSVALCFQGENRGRC